MTLNNLGILCGDTQRLQNAEVAFTEALGCYRELVRENAAAYLPDMAMTLNNLAILYTLTDRLRDAEVVYVETLDIYRGLAREFAAAYLPFVANTLSNLTYLQLLTVRLDEATVSCTDAERVLEPFWREYPAAHGNVMGRILWMRARVMEAQGAARSEICGGGASRAGGYVRRGNKGRVAGVCG